jgi:hypothetical protein
MVYMTIELILALEGWWSTFITALSINLLIFAAKRVCRDLVHHGQQLVIRHFITYSSVEIKLVS